MKCHEIRSALHAYAEGRLSHAERSRVQSHLRACASCQAALARMDRVAAVLLDSEVVEPVPARLVESVMAAARKQQRERLLAVRGPLAWWRAAPAAMRAAAVLFLLIGVGAGIGLGWTSAPAVARERTVANVSPVGLYSLDYLSEAPAGSLTERFMTLATAANEGGR
jgi:anti-sigma factor RsiW